MITISILFIFFGSFALFNTSKKAILQQNLSVEKWLQTNTNKSKTIGLTLLIIALFIAIKRLEITSGIFFWLISLMLILSLLVIIYPLKKINFKHLTVLFVVFFLIEILN